MKTVAGLILAAGKSERMGRPKALLPIFGECFLAHVFSEAVHSNLADVKVVLGHHAERILQALPEMKDRSFINPNYEAGQLSSLQCGLRQLGTVGIDGVMVLLIDHPLIHRDLINQLVEAFSRNDAPIVIPSFGHRGGHPMIFAAELFGELLAAPLDKGAVSVVRKHQHEILHLEVNEPGVLIDIDTPDAYDEQIVSLGKA
ncbi:MAG: nucleotidyltransferase family protein [Acidobacteria bacterium]|nr:nucleotidyltransferase family protein [Acidobacteriota bacterium]